MGGATIVPRSLKTKRNKQNFQDMSEKKYLFFYSYMTLLYSPMRDFPEFDPLTATGSPNTDEGTDTVVLCLYFVVLMKYKINYISLTPYTGSPPSSL